MTSTFPSGDVDLDRALSRLTAAILRALGESTSTALEPCSDDVIALYARLPELLPEPTLSSEAKNLLCAFGSMWPLPHVGLDEILPLIQAVFPNNTKPDELRGAHKMARALIAEYGISRRGKVGRPYELRSRGETFLRERGYEYAAIAALTDPVTPDGGNVRKRVQSFQASGRSPFVTIFSETIQGNQTVRLAPLETLGGHGTSATPAEVPDDARTRGKKRRA